MHEINGRCNENDRICFYKNILYGLENYNSSSDEVNSLLTKFYDKVFELNSKYKRFKKDKNQVPFIAVREGNKVIKEVDENDLIMYMIFKLLHENVGFNIQDDLSKLIYEIYCKLDKVVFPYQKNMSCDAIFNYYTQIIYEEERWKKIIWATRWKHLKN